MVRKEEGRGREEEGRKIRRKDPPNPSTRKDPPNSSLLQQDPSPKHAC
jgi:hypothetical protein